MDDTTVDSTDTGYDDTGSDSTVSDDTGYSDSSYDAGSESSGSYYDADCENSTSAAGDDTEASEDADTVSSGDAEDSSYDGEDSSTYDLDDSGTVDADDTSTETTADTSTYTSNSGVTDTEPVATEADTAGTTATSETAAASQEPTAAMDCPPAFPLTGVTTPEVASVPATADQTAAVAADTGTAGDTPVTDVPVQRPPSFQGIPHGVLSAEQEQAFVQTGWAPALVPDGHGGQVEVLQPAGVDPATFQGQLQFLDNHLRNLIAQQQGGATPAGTVAPIPGTNSGTGTPVAFDGAGNPTHVSYSGVVNPPTTMVQFGGNSALYSNGKWMGGDFPQGTTIENFGGPMRLAPGAPTPAVDPNTPGGAAALSSQALLNQTLSDMTTAALTGVTFDRSTGLVYGDGKPFDNFGDALSAERHPEGPAPR